MKNVLLVGSVSLFILLSGCSQKKAEPVAVDKVEEVVVIDNRDNFVDIGKNAQMIKGELQTIHFDFDKYNINSANQSKLDTDAKVLKTANLSGLNVKVEGNCDEWGSDEYNYALGLKRAKSVRDALSAKGVSANDYILISYGESNPVCTEHTKACWAENRRVNFDVLPK